MGRELSSSLPINVHMPRALPSFLPLPALLPHPSLPEPWLQPDSYSLLDVSPGVPEALCPNASKRGEVIFLLMLYTFSCVPL